MSWPDAGLTCVSPSPGPDLAAEFHIDRGSRCFDGHFPGAPILPGVAHIALALETCAAWPSPPGVLRGLRDLRFTGAIAPGDTVQVLLLPRPSPGAFRFEIRRRGRLVTSGVLIFEPGPAG